MTDDAELLKKRLTELAHRAFSQERYASTEFLSAAEQDTLLGLCFDNKSAPFALYGGYENAERRVALFGSEELCGYEETPPIACVRIAPAAEKFAEALTHRDYLGALMGLGVRRGVTGDILINGKEAYLFCLDTVADFIVSEVKQVRQTNVVCAAVDALPAFAVTPPKEASLNVASERLDAVVAAVYKLSRSDSQELFERDKVFVNSRLTGNTSFQPSPGDVISVRGYGRFIYDGVAKQTRKGRLFVDVRIY